MWGCERWSLKRGVLKNPSVSTDGCCKWIVAGRYGRGFMLECQGIIRLQRLCEKFCELIDLKWSSQKDEREERRGEERRGEERRGEEKRLEVPVREELVVQLCPSLLHGHHGFCSTWIMSCVHIKERESGRNERRTMRWILIALE